MEPYFTNDAVVLGLLMSLLALIFYTASLDHKGLKKFYRIVPTVLLCYFLPALMHWPLGLIAPAWFDSASLIEFLQSKDIALTFADLSSMSFEQIKSLLTSEHGLEESELKPFIQKSKLYFVAPIDKTFIFYIKFVYFGKSNGKHIKSIGKYTNSTRHCIR